MNLKRLCKLHVLTVKTAVNGRDVVNISVTAAAKRQQQRQLVTAGDSLWQLASNFFGGSRVGYHRGGWGRGVGGRGVAADHQLTLPYPPHTSNLCRGMFQRRD